MLFLCLLNPLSSRMSLNLSIKWSLISFYGLLRLNFPWAVCPWQPLQPLEFVTKRRSSVFSINVQRLQICICGLFMSVFTIAFRIWLRRWKYLQVSKNPFLDCPDLHNADEKLSFTRQIEHRRGNWTNERSGVCYGNKITNEVLCQTVVRSVFTRSGKLSEMYCSIKSITTSGLAGYRSDSQRTIKNLTNVGENVSHPSSCHKGRPYGSCLRPDSSSRPAAQEN